MPRKASRFLRGLLAAAAAVAISPLAVTAQSETLSVVGFNVESGGADIDTLAEQVGELQGVDIWGFSEVTNASWAAALELAAAVDEPGSPDFEVILGTTGGGDRLAIVYNAERLELVGTPVELDDINVGGNVRAPLVAQFRLRSSGDEFLFMVNHLYRSRSERRHQQALLLNEWASTQNLPVIAVGDYNFDWDIGSSGARRDQGFDNFLQGDVFSWVRPVELVRTQCSFNSVLDFVFVANSPDWAATSEILFPEAAYCPDSDLTSDHRPVLGQFVLTSGPEPDPLRQQLLERLERLEQEIESLRQLIETNL